MDRKEFMKQIIELQENHCDGCELLKQRTKRYGRHKAGLKCQTDCEIGIRMRHITNEYEFGQKRVMVGQELTMDVYLEERENGLSLNEIKDKYGISIDVLKTRRIHWGMGEDHLKRILTKEEYQSMKDEGYPDSYVTKKHNIHVSTLIRYKKKWGLIGFYDTRISDITPELYNTTKSAGNLTDQEVADELGIGVRTLYTYKRKWRAQGIKLAEWRGSFESNENSGNG